MSRLDVLVSHFAKVYFTIKPLFSVFPITNLLFIALIDKITSLACSIFAFVYRFFCIFPSTDTSRSIPFLSCILSLAFFSFFFFGFGVLLMFFFSVFIVFYSGSYGDFLCNCSFIRMVFALIKLS